MRNCPLPVALLLSAATLLAQTNATDGALDGYVLDATQAAVSAAKITARNVRTNVDSIATTNDAGYYRFALLPVGEYELTVAAPGFREYRQSGINLGVGRQVRIDAALQVGSASESVTVTADAAMVESGQTASGEVVNARSLRSLPIVSRNVYNFNLLGPGVKGIPSTGFGTTQFTFGGTSRAAWNTDGLDNSQRRTNRQIRLVINTPEAIEESQVISNGYSAEFGRAAGGQVNVITRSGTNEFHGSGMFLYRFRDLQARPSLAAVNPERTWKDAAFTLGGPILKNRLFFFAQYEYNPYTLPTAVTITPANATALGLPSTELGNSPFGEDFRTSMMKVSYRLNDKNSGFFRYSRFTNVQPNGAGGLTIPSRGNDFLDRMNGGGFQLATTLSPSTLNEFRFGINRRHELREAVGVADPTRPAVDITGVANIGTNPLAGVENIEQSTQFIDNLTKTAGRHTFKVGADVQITDYKLNTSLDRRFAFQGLAAVAGVRGAVSALDQYLNTVRGAIDPATGRPYTYTQLTFQTGERFLAQNYKFLNFFAQDEFRITPRFTLSFGIRYEALLYPVLDDQAPFELSRRVNNDLGNIAPRIGFTWAPFENRKTVIRGAWGYYYDTPSLGISSGAAQVNGRRVLSYQYTGTDPAAPAFPSFPSTGDTRFAVSPSITAFASDFKNMYQQQSNLQVSRELTRNLLLNVQGNYHFTRFGPYSRDINLGTPVGALADGRPVYGGNNARPDKRFRAINLLESGSNSNYSALDVTLTRRFHKGLQVSGTWSWSHALADNLQEGGSLSDPSFRGRDYGSRESDVRHTMVVQGLYAPEWKFLKNWELSSMVFYNSGYPVNVLSGVDLNADTVLNDRPLFLGRNSVTGPNLVQVDMRLQRRFRIAERYVITGLAEAENMLNKLNANCSIAGGCTGAVVNRFGQADFGRITSARSARNFQLGMKVTF